MKQGLKKCKNPGSWTCGKFYYKVDGEKECITSQNITFVSKDKYLFSQRIKVLFKTFRRERFHRVIKLISEIENIKERHEILNLLYSASNYIENNRYANLLNLYISEIYIKKSKSLDYSVNETLENDINQYNVIIKMVYIYKEKGSLLGKNFNTNSKSSNIF
jgi:hypothetical protein